MQIFLASLMMVAALIISRGSSSSTSEDFSGYYWRDYTGIIPGDAISGGTDKQGKMIFVGQGIFMEIGLLPGTIYSGSKSMEVTAWGKVFATDKNVKILCSQNPEKFRWVPTKVQDLQLLTNCQLIPGEMETETTLHIGRATQDKELLVGKVFPDCSPYKGLALPHKGKEANYKSFEVLAYNCSKQPYCDNLEYKR